MKRTAALALTAAIVLAGAGGGAWYVFGRGGDPLASGRAAADRGDLRTAQIELRNAVKQAPGSAEANYRLGLVQLQLGDAVAAERQLKLARDAGQDPRSLRLPLAQSYVAQGKFQQMLDEFPPRSDPASDPASEPAQAGPMLVLRALSQLGLNDRAAARATAAEAERVAPQFVEAPLAAARVALAEQDYTAAERAVDRTLALDGKRAEALLMRGQLLNARGDRDGAIAALDAAVTQSGGSLAARLERANVLVAAGQDARAREDVDAVLKAEPGSPAGSYFKAVLLSRAGDWQGADQALQRVQTLLGRFPRGYVVQALVKLNLGQLEQAAEAAQRHVARAPDDVEGVRLLATIDLAAGRADKAVEALSRLVASGRADAAVLDLMGRAYTQGGRPADAARSFQRAAEMAPENAGILTRLASSRLQMGDATGATATLERSLELAPAQANASESLVLAALTSGDIERAKAALDRLRAQVGETEAVGNLTGMLRMAQLDPDGAREQFAAVVRAFPNSTAAKMNLARVLVQQNRTAEAERLLSDMLEAEPANDQALSAMVALLLRDNRVGRAVALVEAARRAAPANFALTAVLADLYIRSGEAAKALALLDGPTRTSSPPPALLGARARAQVAAGSKAEAKETYRSILVANPGDTDARQRLMELFVEDKEWDAARALLRDGLRASPGNIGMLQALVSIEQRANGLDAALAAADQLKRDPANMPAAAALRGDVYMSQRRFADAATAYAAELKTTPTSLLALRTAAALNASGAPDRAADSLRTWLGQHPDDADAAQVLASLDIAAKRYPGAERALQTVLDKRPNDAVALNNLAWVLQLRGDERARGLAQRAYAVAPSPEAADTLGWIMTARGDAGNAVALLRQASQARPDNPTIQFHYAQALNAAGQQEEAVKTLTGIVNAPAEFDDKPAARALLQQLSARR